MNQQFTGLQILRFVAAMLVAFVHITQSIAIYITLDGKDSYWHAGGTGVDIFFVISGFVMAYSTRGIAQGGQARVAAAWVFMKRRILRIVPLYWCYTLLKVAVLLVFPAIAASSSFDPGHLAASLLFIPTRSPSGLLQPVLPVGWTLNFEMLFYAVFAIAIALGAFRIRFCVLVFLAIFLAGQTFPQFVPLAFYAQSNIFEFILGVAIAHSLGRYGPAPAVAGVLAVAAGALLTFGIGGDNDAPRLLTVGLGAAGIVLGTVWLERHLERMAGSAALSFLGDASYSIYLSHSFVVPAGVLALRALGVHNALAIAISVAALVVAAGCMSYVWLERPMTSFLKRLMFRSAAVRYPHAANTLRSDASAAQERTP